MSVQHSAIADADRHEPKGASTAASGSVYVSDGAASGTWKWTTQTLTHLVEDLSINPYVGYIVFPFNATIDKMYSVIDSAFTTADKVITLSIGGTNITNGSLTIANSGSAAGDIDSCTPTALNIISAGTALKITATGAAGGTGGYHGGAGTGTAANLTIQYTRTA